MEKKPNITPTPWMTMEDPKNDDFAIKEKSLYKDGQWLFSDRICESGNYTAQNQNNMIAIVTAVNCTYGANLNPEKLKDLIVKLEVLFIAIKKGEITMFPDSEKQPDYLQMVEDALTNIKYKD